MNHFSPLANKISGISVYTWCILRALVEHGRHEYVLATNWDLDRLPDPIRALGIPTHHNPLPRNEARAVLGNTFRVPGIAKRHGCAAILHPQPAAILSEAGRSVVVVHDLYRVTHRHLFPWRQRAQWDLVTARCLRRAAALIAVSHATANDLGAAYPETRARTTVVHEASPIVDSGAEVSPFLSPDGYCLVVANITPNKNIVTLIEALKLLRQQGLRPRVILIGRDDDGVLPALTRGADIAFEHRPGVSEKDLRGLYSRCLAYINTSLTEGFCLPILEAHTFGAPVICSDLPVLHEVAGDAALFFDPTDAAALAVAIRALLGDAQLAAELRRKATENIKRFSWRKAALETEQVFAGVLGRANRTG